MIHSDVSGFIKHLLHTGYFGGGWIFININPHTHKTLDTYLLLTLVYNIRLRVYVKYS